MSENLKTDPTPALAPSSVGAASPPERSAQRPTQRAAQRAAQAPQMGIGAAFALVLAGVLEQTTGVSFDGTTVGAWTALCEGLWQMIRRTMEG